MSETQQDGPGTGTPPQQPAQPPPPQTRQKLSLDERQLDYAELVAAKDQLDAADLLARLHDGRARARANALLGLAAIGHAGTEYVPFLRDGDPRVARTAAEALGQLGIAQRANIVDIARALEGARGDVADAISKMFSELIGKADPELTAVLDTSLDSGANAIVRACAYVGVRGLRLLEAATHDDRTRVRINAVRGIAQLGDLEHGHSMDILYGVERDDKVSDVRATARTALGTLTQRSRSAAASKRKAADPLPPMVPELEAPAPTADQLRAAAATAPVDELTRALPDPRPYVRLNAVKMLAFKGPAEPATVRALAVLTRDVESTIRAEAAAAVGKLGPNAAVAAPALVVALGDPDPTVVDAAEASLAAIGAAAAEALVDGLDTPSEPHGARIAGLIGKLPDGASLLRYALRSTSVDVRVHAALGLGAMGKARATGAVAALGNVPVGANARLRAAVATAMATLEPKPDRVAPKVAIDGFDDRLLDDKALDGGKSALAAAGAAGLAAHLQDAHAVVRANAAAGLGALGGDAVRQIHALAACLRDDSPDVRRAAVRAIDRLGDDAVAASAYDLVRALADADDGLAAKIADALRGRAARAIDDALAVNLDTTDERHADRVLALICARPAGADLLGDAFGRPTAQAHAARGMIALGKDKLGRGRIVLEAARIDPAAKTRDRARATLRAIDGDPAEPEVPSVAGFETELLEPGAFDGKGKGAKLDARGLLVFLNDGRWRVRANAATALGSLGPTVADYATTLGALLRDDDDRVRIAVARALDRIGDDAVITAAPFLVGALRGDAKVADACKATLAARKSKVEDALLAGLETGDETHGLRIAELICALPNARDLLFVAFDGPAQNVTINAALGIGLLGNERAGAGGRKRLTLGLAGPFTRRRDAMVKALAMLGPAPAAPPPAATKR